MRAALVAFFMVLALSIVLASAQENDDLIVLGSYFCSMRKGGAEQPVRYLLTKALLDAIDAAYAASDAFEKQHPGDKPPLGDGIPFQSFPDEADGCGIANYAVVKGVEQADIEYSFKTTEGANWTDRIIVMTENGRPLIDDVLYGAQDYKVGLRDTLKTIIDGKY